MPKTYPDPDPQTGVNNVYLIFSYFSKWGGCKTAVFLPAVIDTECEPACVVGAAGLSADLFKSGCVVCEVREARGVSRYVLLRPSTQRNNNSTQSHLASHATYLTSWL